jgi:hypothetical protein
MYLLREKRQCDQTFFLKLLSFKYFLLKVVLGIKCSFKIFEKFLRSNNKKRYWQKISTFQI